MTPNFTNEELTCKCGCGLLPQQDFMDKVQILRDILHFGLPVTSGARCPTYNNQVSSTGFTGPHTTGRAIDIAVRGNQAYELVIAAMQIGFTGIGVQQKGNARFIHLDDLQNGPNSPRPWMWSY